MRSLESMVPLNATLPPQNSGLQSDIKIFLPWRRKGAAVAAVLDLGKYNIGKREALLILSWDHFYNPYYSFPLPPSEESINGNLQINTSDDPHRYFRLFRIMNLILFNDS